MYVKIWPFRGMFSFTNFTDEDKEVKTLRGWFRHARFFYFPEYLNEGESQADVEHLDHVEWVMKPPISEWSFGFKVTSEVPFLADEDISASISIGPLTVYAGWKHTLQRTRKKDHKRGKGNLRASRYGFDVSGQGIYFHLGDDPGMWSTNDPKWWSFTLHPVDLILGKRVFTSTTVMEVDDFVFLPEGLYPATAKLNRDVWKRKRFPFWPFTKKIMRGEVEMHIPIPIPGKGENSYDMEDDYYHGEYGPAMSVEHALGNMANSAMDTRSRYGGENWVPDAGWPEDILRPPVGEADLYKDDDWGKT